MTRKLIIHDGRIERELVLVGTITVGRDPSCHVNDLDPLLSRKHAEFVVAASGVTVRDLNSRNGMLVNGLKVFEQTLKEGDLVQLGHLQLRYSEDHSVRTSDARSHATTAHESATRAVPAAALEDTRPHPPHMHAGHHDEDVTRIPGSTQDEEPTMAPKGATADADATVAPTRQAPAPVADFDATAAPGAKADPDATFATSGGADLDATFVAGRGPLVMPVASAPTPPPVPNADMDKTFVPGSMDLEKAIAEATADLDKTIAPGSLDLDATFAPGSPASAAGSPASAAGSPASATGSRAPLSKGPATAARYSNDARITAGADLRVTSASAACRAMFNVAPDSLVGRPLGDVLTDRLKNGCATGPCEISFIVERSPSDRSLIVILKAAQAVETVS